MYYFACIDEKGVCYAIEEWAEYNGELDGNPYYISIPEYDYSLIRRKKYVDGQWVDTTASEGQNYDGMHVGLRGEWLDVVIDAKADVSHEHSGYAVSNHTHEDYATQVALDTLATEVDGKANTSHTHTEYSVANHSHSEYAALSHSHTNYATTTALSELSATVSGKANASHSHSDLYYTEEEVNNLLSGKSDSSHNHTGVYDTSGSAANALTSAKAYTDSEIETLNETVSGKANASDLTSHTGNTTIHVSQNDKNNWNVAKTHADSAHAPSNAEPNQNAFSNVVIGSTTISADNTTDTLTFVAGNNITLTPDSTGDSITISSANTIYTHPTTAGNKHIPAGGSSGQILRWASDGTATWGNDNNTTYSNATQTTSGLMSNTDKTKLDSIAEGANNYTLPSAGSSLGGVKSGGDVTISSGVITVNDDSHNHVISNIDGLQSALDGKAASSHSHNDIYYTETEMDSLLSAKANSSHAHAISDITNLQTTLDGKAATSHGTHVSYSSTAPVMDGTASVGIASTVARSDHRHPTDTSRAAQTSLDSHTSNKSNPHGVSLSQLGITATASELNALDGITATVTELNYVDGVTSNIQTQLNGKAASGHTHSAATTSAAGFMSASDKAKLDGIASGANAYTLPTASSTLGGVKTTSTVTSASGYTACPIIGGVPYYKDTNNTYNLGSFGVTATATELNYVDGVTSNVQTQLNNKMPKTPTSIELNQGGSLKGYGGFIDFHYYDADGNSSTNTDYSSRIIEGNDGIISINDITFNRNGKIATATTFNGTTFSGSGVATVSEVETYLGI